MTKVNASTGDVIKKNDADTHIPKELDQGHTDHQEEDNFFKLPKADIANAARSYDDDNEEDANDLSESTETEEELSVVDET